MNLTTSPFRQIYWFDLLNCARGSTCKVKPVKLSKPMRGLIDLFGSPLKWQSWSTNIIFCSNFRILICPRSHQSNGIFWIPPFPGSRPFRANFDKISKKYFCMPKKSRIQYSAKSERGFNTLQSLLRTNRALNLA